MLVITFELTLNVI